METGKIKWMAAIPYLLVLTMVINGDILENYDFYAFGTPLSLSILIPYIIYHFVNRGHKIEFIAGHTKRAMSIFIKYFILTILLSIIVSVAEVGLTMANPDLLFTSSLIALVLFYIAVFYVLITATLGSIRAFKLILPNRTLWQPNNR